jgi:glycosyltransferase involved in cell wall biosynthesis
MRLSYYSFDSLGNPWVSGGGAVRDFEVLRRFARHGAQVTLYVAWYPGFVDRTEDGVKIRGIGFGRSHGLNRVTFTLAANLRVMFDRADIVGNSASIFAPILTGLLRRRFYAVYHHRVGARSIEKFGILGWIPRLWEMLMLGCGRRYVISNATLAEHVRAHNKNASVFVTFNGFAPSLLDLPRRASHTLTPSPSPSGKRAGGEGVAQVSPFVLFIGRFDVYMKGLDLLIPAWADTLAARGIDLVLAGRASPGDLETVRALVPPAFRDRVHVETSVSEERKAELLSTCLFFASPSRFEGFGIAALEANAAGVAVLATDTDGFRDSLALGTTAFAVPVEDVAALREGLTRLAEDVTLREGLGEAGRARARGFSWDAIADKEWDWIVGETSPKSRQTGGPRAEG